MKAFLFSVVFLVHLRATAQPQPVASLAAFPKPDTVSSLQPKLAFQASTSKPLSHETRLVSRSVAVLAVGGSIGLLTYKFVDEPLREFSLKHHSPFSTTLATLVQPLGHSDYMIPAGGAVYATGLVLRNPKLQRTGLLLVSSLLLNDMVTSNLKDEFQRRRPDEANHNFYFEGGEGGRHYASFPSAHTSTAFTFATSVASVYHDHKWVPPVAYGTATLVGLSRIYDNKHWATDVLAGALVGFVTAKGTNFILTQTEKQLVKRKVNIYVLPKVSNGATGLSFGGTF